MGKARSSATAPVERAAVASLDLEGRGVAHVDGKAVFISGALPGEVVRFVRTRERASYAQGELVAVERASCWRVTPRCPHFGVCGGCAMQPFDASAQVAAKQRVLRHALAYCAGAASAGVAAALRAVLGVSPSGAHRRTTGAEEGGGACRFP
jgi:23S rRNA (uracil1939-C5)-methyltransferase